MRTSINIIVATILSVGCIGVAHNGSAQDLPPHTPSTTSPYPWHDGSKGGIYGIGEDWSFAILHAQYKSVIETYVQGGNVELKTIPAEFEWIKDETVGPQVEAEMALQLVTIPATYKTVMETLVTAPAKMEYDLIEPVFNPDQTLKSPAHVETRHVKVVTEQKERRVVNVPERTVERLMPVEHREGYRRVILTPARLTSYPAPEKMFSFKRTVETQPVRFRIYNLRNGVSHTFESYENFATFVESLKSSD